MAKLQLSSATSDNPKLNGYLAIGIALSTLPITPILLKLALQEGMPPQMITLGRLVLATLILTPIIFTRHRDDLNRLSRKDIIFTMAAGFWLGIHFITIIASLEHIPVLVNQVLLSTSPIWVALLEVMFLKERLPRAVWAALVIVLIGSTIIAGANSGTSISTIEDSGKLTLGLILALASAIAMAIYLVIGRKGRSRIAFLPYVWLAYLGGAIVALITVIYTSTPIVGYSSNAYLYLLGITLVPQLIGHSSINYALAYLPATLIGISSQLIVVVSAILAFILLSEIPLPLQILGSMTILTGVIIAIVGNRSASPESSSQ